MRTMLIYGATGKAGRLVMERALERGWAVAAFVRNPDKVPEALRAKATVIKGDLCDAAAVSAAVRSSRPDAIVDASSALTFGHRGWDDSDVGNPGPRRARHVVHDDRQRVVRTALVIAEKGGNRGHRRPQRCSCKFCATRLGTRPTPGTT
jgi:hypothetical protein